MARRKKTKVRPYTEVERQEVHRLAYLGKTGRLTEAQQARCSDLYEINPAQYGQISTAAAREAVVAMYPWMKTRMDAAYAEIPKKKHNKDTP